MKTIFTLILLPLLIALPIQAQDKPVSPEKVTIKLTSGETMTGKLGGIKDGSVNLITDYGVIRLPVEKLTADSRKSLDMPPQDEVSMLKSRVTDLEALVATLREENANLRKQTAPGTSATTGTQITPRAETPWPQAGAAEGAFKLSNSGKRHNSRCRYFSSAGSACGPNDGVACKVCGG